MAYDTATLTGTYQLPDATPARGVVEIIPSERLIVDDAGDVILSGRVKVTLDAAGSFSVDLPATDDPALTPTGFGYTVAAKLHHAHLPAVSFSLPAAVAVVDITDVTTVDPSTFEPDANYVTPAQASATYARLRALDPREFGAVGDGVADDTAALQACLTAAGSDAVELPPMTFKVTSTLTVPNGCQLRGTGNKGAVLAAVGDITVLKTVGGEGQTLSNFKITNPFAGTRTTHDIEMVNPYHPLIADVEIALSQSSLIKGGIYIHHDEGQANPTQKNMPTLRNVWVRNGVLRIVDVGDVKVEGGWVWGTYTNAPGAVELDRASNYIAVNFDVIPSVNAGYYISGGTSNFTLIGGLMDGNGDAAIHPANGMKVATGQYVRSLQLIGVKFWNLWQSALDLYDARAVTITGCEFRANNREDNFHPEIKLVSSRDVVATGNTFSAVDARTNKGLIWSEDAASSDNLLTGNTIETGHQYASGIFSIQPSSALRNNMPLDVWPDTAQLAKSSNYTVTKYDILNGRIVLTTSAATITLPSSASLSAGNQVTIKAGAVTTIATTSAQTIDGSIVARVLFAGESITVMADGGNWRTLGQQSAPRLVVPPLSVLTTTSATVWSAANTAAFSRFTLTQPTPLRYANIRVDVSSGNWQIAVVRLSGTSLGDYTRIMDTGVVAMPTAGDKRVDLGSTILPPGEYAIAVWCNNITAQLRHASNSSIPITHLSAEVASLASGVPASGAGVVWNSNRILGSLTIEADV